MGGSFDDNDPSKGGTLIVAPCNMFEVPETQHGSITAVLAMISAFMVLNRKT